MSRNEQTSGDRVRLSQPRKMGNKDEAGGLSGIARL
jgi:hypothetical protein